MEAEIKGLKHTDKKELFTYELREDIYTGQHENFRNGETITISFFNGTFDGVSFPFSGHYTRNHWKILRFIEEEITRLENSYSAPKAG